MLKKRWGIGFILGVFILLQGCDEAGLLERQIAVGKPFPEMKLVTYDNEPFTLEQLRGQVVILKMWATWCGVCREEAPHFLAFSKKLEGSVVIASVSVDQNVNSAKEYLLEHPNDFLQLFDQSMIQTKTVLKVSVLPQVYIIDASGVLRYYVAGSVEWSDGEMLKRVRLLLSEGD